MNDKIKELLKNAEQSDSIAINKWRIENREQLRKERKEKLKELMEKDKTMSNNKQSMKLYTEEQIFKYLLENGTIDLDSFILDMKPIELPSDEELEKQAEHEDTYSKKCAFTRGAKWMWRKTFGGNNEQQ